MSTYVIVNPNSRLGETGRRLEELRSLACKHLGRHLILETRREGDGEHLGRQARASGASCVVVAGGDGTVSEVLSGLLGADGQTDIELAVLPLGTGRDFARLLTLETGLEQAVARIREGRKRRVDAGRVTALGQDGLERRRCFMNIASLGVSGESALWLRREASLGRRDAVSYLMSGVIGMARYAAPRVELRLDGVRLHDGRLTLAAIANGQYFAGGLQIAPRARIDDGVFDVIVVPKLSPRAAVLGILRLSRGRHIDGTHVRLHRGRVLEATGDATVWIEADGEPIGHLPARFELLPQAVTLCGLL